MAAALEKASEMAPASMIGEWVERVAHEALTERAARVAALEPESLPMTAQDAIHARSRRAGPRRLPTYAIALVAVALMMLIGLLIVFAARLLQT